MLDCMQGRFSSTNLRLMAFFGIVLDPLTGVLADLSTCLINSAFFQLFGGNDRNWIFRNLEFSEKFLEFSQKILEFSKKIP